MDEKPNKPQADDDRLAIPLDPVEALRALLKVDPDSEPATPPEDREHGARASR